MVFLERKSAGSQARVLSNRVQPGQGSTRKTREAGGRGAWRCDLFTRRKLADCPGGIRHLSRKYLWWKGFQPEDQPGNGRKGQTCSGSTQLGAKYSYFEKAELEKMHIQSRK